MNLPAPANITMILNLIAKLWCGGQLLAFRFISESWLGSHPSLLEDAKAWCRALEIIHDGKEADKIDTD